MTYAPIRIIRKSDFKQEGPCRISWNSGESTIEQPYNLFTDDKDFTGRSRVIHVGNVDDIELIRSDVMGKPLILMVTCTAFLSSARPSQENCKTDDFVFIIDTCNDDVRNVLNETFDKAKQLMQENKTFSVWLDQDEAIKNWYKHKYLSSYHRNFVHRVEGAGIHIVHFATPPRDDEVMDCTCLSLTGCMCLSCICFLIIPCCICEVLDITIYYIDRKYIQKVIDVKISGFEIEVHDLFELYFPVTLQPNNVR